MKKNLAIIVPKLESNNANFLGLILLLLIAIISNNSNHGSGNVIDIFYHKTKMVLALCASTISFELELM